ncbi:hypothetical protein M514_01356 [Trichuris suis]|uniref:Uncharacterized protein n=1 Tax=Trichuris suis TaxID=68888 RepID=A0A085NRY4_9BILA|nr:hypothetical protein M513_01356 [Trichuris suis]KFD72230.1 hypothetical protein M514_01356 [Trichuris suis]
MLSSSLAICRRGNKKASAAGTRLILRVGGLKRVTSGKQENENKKSALTANAINQNWDIQSNEIDLAGDNQSTDRQAGLARPTFKTGSAPHGLEATCGISAVNQTKFTTSHLARRVKGPNEWSRPAGGLSSKYDDIFGAPINK